MSRTMEDHRVVVLGAGYAGLMTAVRTARRTRRRGGHVTVVNPSPTFVERLRLHQIAAGQTGAENQISDLLGRTGAELVVGRATGIDLVGRSVEVDTPRGRQSIGYDTLVYALGSTIDQETVPGAATHAHALAGPDAAARLAATASELAARGGDLVVCGGGFTGIEAATELAEAYPDLTVRLVTRGTIGAEMSEAARRYLHEAFTRLGVVVREHTDIVEVQAGALRLAGDGGAFETMPFGACVWAGSFRVAPLAAQAGLAVDGRGRMQVDATLRSVSHPNVYAVGDAAAAPLPSGETLRMTCQGGMPTGAHAADVIADRLAGRDPKPFRFGYIHMPISLGRRDGLIQFVRPDDTPRRAMLTGRRAAWYKELVTGSGVWAIRLTHRWTGGMTWPSGGRATRHPIEPTAEQATAR